MADKTLLFDAGSQLRIARATLAYEQAGGNLDPDSLGGAPDGTEFWAKVTSSGSVNNTTGYAWSEVYRDGDNWTVTPKGRTGILTADSKGVYSYAISTGGQAGTGAIVRIRVSYNKVGSGPATCPAYTFQASQAGVFPVMLTMDGGSGGGTGSACSYTYTCKDLSGNPLADGTSSTSTQKTPEMNAVMWRLPGVYYSAASGVGHAYYDNSSPPALHLSIAPEAPSAGNCNTAS